VAVCLDCGREEEEETCNNNNNNMIDGRRLNPIRVKDPKEKVMSPFTHTQRERENQKAQTIICRHYRVCTKLSLSGLPIFRLRSDGISSFFFSLVFRLSQQQQQQLWWFVFSCLVPGLHTHERPDDHFNRTRKKVDFIFGFAFFFFLCLEMIDLKLVFWGCLFFDFIVCDTAVT
jgi:hypothetical protein